MELKKIIIVYWHLTKYPDLKFEHNQTFPYSVKKRTSIINTILSKGYHVMITQFPDVADSDEMYIWIDNKRFRQA
jgi:hypothetical protein